MPGGLCLVATPIGNLGDLSPRAVEALKAADVWVVEDTRISAKLAFHLDIKKPMRVMNDHTTPAQVIRYVDEIAAGSQIAVVTDGGSPTVSDPGAILTDACLTRGLPVTGVPGPCAAIYALSLSGFFGQRFVFLGFLGRKAGAIRGELTAFADSPLTIILYESPHRIETLLSAAHDALGPRRYAIGRELTKAFEQVYRAELPYIPTEEEVPRKGEITVVIEGRRRVRGVD